MIESSLGIVGACLPLMRPIIQKMSPQDVFRSLHRMLGFSASRSNGSLKKTEAKTTLVVACSPIFIQTSAPNQPQNNKKWEDS